jgi:hypothetical protein
MLERIGLMLGHMMLMGVLCSGLMPLPTPKYRRAFQNCVILSNSALFEGKKLKMILEVVNIP